MAKKKKYVPWYLYDGLEEERERREEWIRRSEVRSAAEEFKKRKKTPEEKVWLTIAYACGIGYFSIGFFTVAFLLSLALPEDITSRGAGALITLVIAVLLGLVVR